VHAVRRMDNITYLTTINTFLTLVAVPVKLAHVAPAHVAPAHVAPAHVAPAHVAMEPVPMEPVIKIEIL
jgi:hypothetical protein